MQFIINTEKEKEAPEDERKEMKEGGEMKKKNGEKV